MKCEIQYQNYKFLTLNPSTDLNKRAKSKPALKKFLDATQNPSNFEITLGTKPNQKIIKIDGGILVWGRVSNDGKKSKTELHGFADILSLESIINDLIEWDNKEYKTFNVEY